MRGILHWRIIQRVILIAFIIVLCVWDAQCGEKKSRLYQAMGVVLVGTAAGDLWSTELALRSPDVREANPFMATSPEARIAAKASATALVFVGSDVLHSKGHPRMALWLRIATVAVWGYATAHNLRNVE